MNENQIRLLEKTTLGCVFLNPKLAEQLIAELTEEHFRCYGNVFTRIKELTLEDKKVTMPLIGNNVPIGVLTDIATSVCTDTEFESYIGELRSLKHRTDLIKYTGDIERASRSNIDNKKLIKMINNVPSELGNKVKFISSTKLVDKYLNTVAVRMSSEDDIEGLRTGYNNLDKLVGGMKEAETIGVKAESNVGKSLFVKDVSVNVARAGYRVDMFSYEMNNVRTMGRIMPSITGVPAKCFKFPKQLMTKERLKEIADSDIEFLENLHIYADELETKSVEEIRANINKTNLREGTTPDLIIVDYLQILSHNEKESWKGSEVNNKKLKDLAKKYKCPVIIIYANAKDGSIRGSGEILYDVDQVWELIRDVENEDPVVSSMTDLIVSKSRASETGRVALEFDKQFITFRED